jgi:hypothetical protein
MISMFHSERLGLPKTNNESNAIMIIMMMMMMICYCSLITGFLFPDTSPLEPMMNPTTQARSLRL